MERPGEPLDLSNAIPALFHCYEGSTRESQQPNPTGSLRTFEPGAVPPSPKINFLCGELYPDYRHSHGRRRSTPFFRTLSSQSGVGPLDCSLQPALVRIVFDFHASSAAPCSRSSPRQHFCYAVSNKQKISVSVVSTT
jgi:hypothetical protein